MSELLVLVHGSFGHPDTWSQVRLMLKDAQVDVATPTLPNWGSRRNEPVRNLTAAAMAEDVASQVEAADRSVHIVGYSMGGVVALELALERRWTLSSLTLIEATTTPVLRLTDRHHEAEEHAEACYAFAEAVAAGSPDPAAMVFEGNNGPGYWNALPEHVRATLNKLAPAASRDALMEAERRYDAAELARLDLPTAVAHGSATAPRLRHVSEALAGILPRAELVVIEGGNHDVVRTHPAEVTEVILRSLRRSRLEQGVRDDG